MRHLIATFAVALCCTMGSMAQPPMTLSQCIAYAQEHHPSLIRSKLQGQLSEREKREAILAFLPGINASAEQSVSLGRSQDKTGVYHDNSSTSTSFNIGGSMTLFDGGSLWYAYKKSDLATKLSGYTLRQAGDALSLKVVDAYIQALMAREMSHIARHRLALTQSSHHDVEAQVKAGRLSEARLAEMSTQLATDQLALTETEADLRRSLALLAAEMGATASTEITLPEHDAQEIVQRSILSAKEQQRSIQWITPERALAEGELLKSEYDVKQARAALMPSLSLSAGYNNGYYYNLDKQLQDFNAPFVDQIKTNGRSFVGLSLNIPIFAKGTLRGALYKSKLQQVQLAAEVAQRKLDEERNITLARLDLDKAQAQQEKAAQQSQYATEAFRYADLQFKAGRMSSYEWEQAKNKESEAKVNYLRSIYTLIQSKIHYNYFLTGVIDTTLFD